jgi:hypothetical protein
MGIVTVQQMADRVSGLLQERLRVRGDTLEARLRAAGRRLPRHVREAGQALAAALIMLQNPKLMHQVDDETVAVAYDICVRHLTAIDRAAARRGILLDIAARIAFVLLAVGVLLVAVLHWRGFI